MYPDYFMGSLKSTKNVRNTISSRYHVGNDHDNVFKLSGVQNCKSSILIVKNPLHAF